MNSIHALWLWNSIYVHVSINNGINWPAAYNLLTFVCPSLQLSFKFFFFRKASLGVVEGNLWMGHSMGDCLSVMLSSGSTCNLLRVKVRNSYCSFMAHKLVSFEYGFLYLLQPLLQILNWVRVLNVACESLLNKKERHHHRSNNSKQVDHNCDRWLLSVLPPPPPEYSPMETLHKAYVGCDGYI